MKKLFVLAFAMLLSAPVSAYAVEDASVVSSSVDSTSPRKSRWYFGLGGESRMTKKISSDAEYESKAYPSVFAAYKRNWFQTLSELNWFEESTHAGSLEIEYSKIEFRQWARGLLYPKKSWSPHAGLSVGTFKEEVKTHFYSDSRTSRSGYEFNIGAEAGIQGVFYDWLFSEINFRTLQDVSDSGDLTEFDRWSWSLQLRLGFSI